MAVVCLLAAHLLSSPTQGGAAAAQSLGGSTSGDAPEPCAPRDCGAALRSAVELADQGELGAAATMLSDALDRCPEHPGLLDGLAGVRLRQGRFVEAEALARRLVGIDPSSDHGWELLAAARYLRDDTRGALRAWEQGRSPVVRTVEVHVVGHDGRRSLEPPTDLLRGAGIEEGRPLTVEALLRAERRLGALPAASQTRLGYRIRSGHEAAVEGTVVLGPSNPFTVMGLAAHAVRGVAGRIHVISADLTGRLERWELAGAVEGSLRSVAVSVAHPAPGGAGVWRWAAEHASGRYEEADGLGVVAEERSGVAWRRADWITAALQGAAEGRIDVRPGRGIFAGVGSAWTFAQPGSRRSIEMEGAGWIRVASSGGEGRGRFGRLSLRAALEPPEPRGAAAPSGVAFRAGVVAISPGAPPDLAPRMGAGGATSVLMRARSDLDDEGVLRPLLPGSAWVHGGVEALRGVAALGPVGFGLAAFVDGAGVVAGAAEAGHPARRRWAAHLGVGVRARLTGVAGWLRADWGVDPTSGRSSVSAAWVVHRAGS